MLAMREQNIVEKLKLDIEEREKTYQKELEKIKKEDDLLNYIKGMLAITKTSVSNFPYYDGTNQEDEVAEEDFNIMLKYTLKEDKIISSFKSEIKNLYYLEKIGYQHAEQYQETIKKLEDYRSKIEEAYEELLHNETLKKATEKKEEIIKKLDVVKEHLIEPEEIENIDSFYEGLQYAHLSETEKTSILLSILEKTIAKQEEKKTIERKIGTIKKEDIEKIKDSTKKLESNFQVKITYPTNENTRTNKNRFLFAQR